jgi:hypothetical protein
MEESEVNMQEILYYYFEPASRGIISGHVEIPDNLSEQEEIDWLYDNGYFFRHVQRPNDYFFWNLYKESLYHGIPTNDATFIENSIRILNSMEEQGYDRDFIDEFRSFIEPHIENKYKREARNVLAAKNAGLLESKPNILNRVKTNSPALNKVIGLAPFITTTTGYLMNEYRTGPESKGTVYPALRNRRRRIEGLPVEPPRKPGTGTGGGKRTRKNIKRKGTRRNKY